MKLTHYLTRHPKKHIIFDFDETLFILESPWETWRKEIRIRLRPLDKNRVAQYEGKSTVLLINDFVAKYGRKARNVVIPYMEQFEEKYTSIAKYNEEILSFIRVSFPKYSFHIWSSNMGKTIKDVLKNQSLDKYFTEIVGRDRVLLTKPHPEGFKFIYKPTKHKLTDFLFVGDSIFDQTAAQSCGIDYLKIKLER